MDMVFVCIFGGMFFSVIILAIGVVIGERISERQPCKHNTDTVPDTSCDRVDRSDTVHNRLSTEEVIDVLEELSLVLTNIAHSLRTSPHERDCLIKTKSIIDIIAKIIAGVEDE